MDSRSLLRGGKSAGEPSLIADGGPRIGEESPKPKLLETWSRHSSVTKVAAEMALAIAAYSTYAVARGLVYDDRMSPAFDNAWEIINLERGAGIFKELAVQEWFLDNSSAAVHFFNWFYVLGYWPVILPVAVFLYLRNRQAYHKYRTVALITLGVALIIYEVYPLAPPRMVSALGFVDTIRQFGLERYHAASVALLYNPYASMPSLHFALAFIVSLHFLRSNGGAIGKLLVSGYLGLMLASIVVTGNHYIVDAVGSVSVVGAAFLIRNLSMSFLSKLSGDSSGLRERPSLQPRVPVSR